MQLAEGHWGNPIMLVQDDTWLCRPLVPLVDVDANNQFAHSGWYACHSLPSTLGLIAERLGLRSWMSFLL